MPVISTNQNATVFVNTNDKDWLFKDNVKINVANGHGIYESGSGNKMTVLADITVSGMTYAGITFQGSASEVSVGGKSVINAQNARAGIQYDGSGGHITVNGQIKGGDYGIHGNIWAVVEINGSVSGNQGIAFDGDGADITNNGLIETDSVGISTGALGSLIVNGKDGEIRSGLSGVEFAGTGEAVFTNRGLLKADTAILGGDSSLTITNTGRIVGDVYLGDDGSVFDTRKGILTGTVYGGEESDTYYIADGKTKLVEAAGQGTDAVRSTVGYTLGSNFERLHLLGQKDINGSGNADDNYVFGNSGANHLFGRNGNDLIQGNKGDDILTGNLGNDQFAFFTGDGKDRITDFDDGFDKIETNYVESAQAFNDLDNAGKIKQIGDDVVINFGNGDRLVIDHFLKGDLSYLDFV